MPDIKILYATAPSLIVAQKVATALIEESVAACVNILPQIHSVYRWEGKIETSEEVVLIIKTTLEQASAAKNLFLKTLPYDVPCVLEFSISEEFSHSPYLSWVADSVDRPK